MKTIDGQRAPARRGGVSEPGDVQLVLDHLRDWCFVRMLEASGGRSLEDAGRASAYARVLAELRHLLSTQR